MLYATFLESIEREQQTKPLAFIEICLLGKDDQSKQTMKKMCESLGATLVCNPGPSTTYAISEHYSQQVINIIKYGRGFHKVLKKQWITDIYTENKFIFPKDHHVWNDQEPITTITTTTTTTEQERVLRKTRKRHKLCPL